MTELFVSDLDGTLLGSGATLSDHTRRTLCALLEDGVHFTVATARAFPSIRSLMSGVPLRLPVIELNGALLTEPGTGAPLKTHALPADVAHEAAELMWQHGLLPFIASVQEACVQLYYEETPNEGMRWFLQEKVDKGDPRLRRTARRQAPLSGDVLTLTVLDAEEPIRQLDEKVRERFSAGAQVHCFAHPYCPGFWELSIQSAQATKANGICALKECVDPDYQKVTVFGDHLNDRDMFAFADRAVAVENAADELMALATEVTATNDEDGVAQWLKRHFASQEDQ